MLKKLRQHFRQKFGLLIFFVYNNVDHYDTINFCVL